MTLTHPVRRQRGGVGLNAAAACGGAGCRSPDGHHSRARRLSGACRQVEQGRGDRPCLLAEGNEPGQERHLSYSQTLAAVCRLVSPCAGA